MTSRRNHTTQQATTTISTNSSSADDIINVDRKTNDNQDAIVEEDGNAPQQDDNKDDIRDLKSRVWNYSRKRSADEAECLTCHAIIRTNNGATSTLRKHLVLKHNFINIRLTSTRRNKTAAPSINRERKLRLDYLANLAIFEDGRTFGDLRKSDLKIFLDEAILGILFY